MFYDEDDTVIYIVRSIEEAEFLSNKLKRKDGMGVDDPKRLPNLFKELALGLFCVRAINNKLQGHSEINFYKDNFKNYKFIETKEMM